MLDGVGSNGFVVVERDRLSSGMAASVVKHRATKASVLQRRGVDTFFRNSSSTKGRKRRHRERHHGELESSEIICEVTIVHPRSGVGRHSLSFVVVVLRGVVIARERRESSFQYDRRTFVIVASFCWSGLE